MVLPSLFFQRLGWPFFFFTLKQRVKGRAFTLSRFENCSRRVKHNEPIVARSSTPGVRSGRGSAHNHPRDSCRPPELISGRWFGLGGDCLFLPCSVLTQSGMRRTGVSLSPSSSHNLVTNSPQRPPRGRAAGTPRGEGRVHESPALPWRAHVAGQRTPRGPAAPFGGSCLSSS